jgi:putative FmdB family regulatory protein
MTPSKDLSGPLSYLLRKLTSGGAIPRIKSREDLPEFQESMPLYEYQCKKCHHRFERIQKFSDPHVKKCPDCGGRVEQMISAASVQFKGSGFYVTDYPKKSSQSSSSNGDSASKGDSGAKKEEKSKPDSSQKSESSSKSESTAKKSDKK